MLEQLFKSKLKGYKQPKPPNEIEIVKLEMRRVLDKIERSRNNFLYAEEEFNDIAVLELYCDELKYEILYRKLLLLYGRKKTHINSAINSRAHLAWLIKDNCS